MGGTLIIISDSSSLVKWLEVFNTLDSWDWIADSKLDVREMTAAEKKQCN